MIKKNIRIHTVSEIYIYCSHCLISRISLQYRGVQDVRKYRIILIVQFGQILRCHYDVTHQGIHCVLTEGDHKQSVVQVPYGGTLPNLIVKLNIGEKTVLQKVCLTCTSHSHKIHCFK